MTIGLLIETPTILNLSNEMPNIAVDTSTEQTNHGIIVLHWNLYSCHAAVTYINQRVIEAKDRHPSNE